MANNKIKMYRKQKKFTVTELAEKCGVSKSYISLLENGSRSNPTQVIMVKISNALGKSVQAVFYPKN